MRSIWHNFRLLADRLRTTDSGRPPCAEREFHTASAVARLTGTAGWTGEGFTEPVRLPER